ncbi:MAG: TlyA family RNA methyltransferase, partial [Deltaproteobacteria bacterium]|nr:TlyA family RNA methyltransferase [Deltaproteobacteria bacterium]
MAGTRLDILLFKRGLTKSREAAHALILAGRVWSGQMRLEKPGQSVAEDIQIEIQKDERTFVSRAGLKLEHALIQFNLSVVGRVCLDIGASTGGFTDCLLQKGARRVFAVDVGYGQLDSKLRSNPAVTVLERTNARYLTSGTMGELAKDIDFVCADVSFISLRKIIEPLSHEFPKAKDWVLLFKPQFEVGREFVRKGGIVKNV